MNYRKLLLYTLTSLLLTAVTPFNDVQKTFSTIHPQTKSAIRQEDYKKAKILLGKLKGISPEIYRLNNYPLLEAALLEKTGDPGSAITVLQTALGEKSVLEDHILHKLALLLQTKKPDMSILHLKKLISSHPNSIYRADSYLKIAEIYEFQGKYSLARTYYQKWGRQRRYLKNESRFRRAMTYEKEKKFKKATDLYHLLLYGTKRRETTLKSLERLEALENLRGKPYFATYKSFYLRGMTAFVNRRYDLAEKYFTKLLRNSRKNPYRIRAYYYLARTFERSERYKAAVVQYEKLIRVSPRGMWYLRGLYQRARGLFRLGRNKEAIASLTKIIKTNSRHTQALSAYFLLFQNSIAGNDYAKALKLGAKIKKYFPRSSISKKVTLETAIIQLQQGKHESAIETINSLLRKGGSSSFKAELLFWKARIYEATSQPLKAQEQLTELIRKYPNDFYRYLAQDKLKVYYTGQKQAFYETLMQQAQQDILSSEKEAIRKLIIVASVSPYLPIREKAIQKLKYIKSRNKRYREVLQIKPYAERPVLLSRITEKGYNRHLLKASELAFLGLYEEAAEEFRVYRVNDHMNLEKLLTLATYYYRGKNVNRALYWGESLVNLIGKDVDHLFLPESVKKLMFPLHFTDIVEDFARQRGINKYFVLALIREESKFKADAKSPAAARGLMQFIPSTARDIATELGLEEFEIEELYSPEFNINLGTRYLSNLMSNYKNNYVHVLSAYNSGKSNTERWKKRCISEEPEEFIAKIDYSETRSYVKRVMASFRTYLSLNNSDQSENAR